VIEACSGISKMHRHSVRQTWASPLDTLKKSGHERVIVACLEEGSSSVHQSQPHESTLPIVAQGCRQPGPKGPPNEFHERGKERLFLVVQEHVFPTAIGFNARALCQHPTKVDAKLVVDLHVAFLRGVAIPALQRFQRERPKFPRG
jgi:hypothetical protein